MINSMTPSLVPMLSTDSKLPAEILYAMSGAIYESLPFAIVGVAILLTPVFKFVGDDGEVKRASISDLPFYFGDFLAKKVDELERGLEEK